MTNRRLSPNFTIASARPRGPRCHGGASSLLRLGQGATPARAEATRVEGWLGRPASNSGVEHVLGMPVTTF